MEKTKEKMNEYFMRQALKEAEKAKAMDEVPVGAVVVREGKIISRGHNCREKTNRASSHAEFIAMEKASKKLGTWCLQDCDLYVTLEPCMMCAGMGVLSRIRSIYYGTEEPKSGMVDSLVNLNGLKSLNHHPEIHSGILKEECSSILKEYFREKRRRKKRDKSQFKIEKESGST